MISDCINSPRRHRINYTTVFSGAAVLWHDGKRTLMIKISKKRPFKYRFVMDENITVIQPDMCCSLSSDKNSLYARPGGFPRTSQSDERRTRPRLLRRHSMAARRSAHVWVCVNVCVCTFVWVLRNPLANATVCVCVCVIDTVVSSISAVFIGLVGWSGWGRLARLSPCLPICLWARPGEVWLKDGEPGRCAAIKRWHGSGNLWEERATDYIEIVNLEGKNIQNRNIYLYVFILHVSMYL